MTPSTRFSLILTTICGLALASGCTSNDDASAGNTQINLDIVNPGGTSGELGFSVDRVDYRITCAGNPPGSYPIPPGDTLGTDYDYDDSVDISGAFETVDTRVPPVWQAVMDLPPGDCTITLSVYEDDEVVCVGSQTLAIVEDGTTKYDIVLVCSLSIDTPDGMADVDGTFEFITGNICPKLYVLNAIPSEVVQDASNPDARTEIQYRAKDPDNTCGNNCDPQSCTTDNPPVCTPAPYNPNDPACNPAAGGDPNSAACQDGVSHVGLVCTIAAVPTASGVPGGTFINPQDGVTPVGPILPVNLNTASGIPGIILPGLGGPAGTNAENSPAYPGLPNVNGSLPPLLYECDTTIPGPVIMNLDCSDGDAECDQNKQIIVNCPGINFCIDFPIDCSGSNDCATDGTCDATCDPSDIGGPDCPGGTRCPGQDDVVPDGTPCSTGFAGSTGQVCLLGFCVECIISENGPDGNPNCDSTPVDCLLPSLCFSNACQPRQTAPDGTPCSNGECVGGVCQFVPVDPCQDTPASECTKVITVGCGNNVTADVSILPFQLDVDPGPILDGDPITADLGGVAEFSETFLDAAQGAVVGGVTKAGLVSLNADIQVRQGTTSPGTVVANMTAGAGIPTECWLSDTGPGVQEACDVANDLASVPGARGNSDCAVPIAQNPCVPIVEVPISTDCTPTGACALAGKGSGTSGQCANGFCVTGGLPLPLDPQTGVALGTADASSGDLLIGWYDTPADASAAVGTPAIDGDGTYNMQQASYTGVAGPVGLAVFAGLQVQLECVMAEDSGQAPPLGVGVPDDASPTPDSQLISFPVQVP